MASSTCTYLEVVQECDTLVGNDLKAKDLRTYDLLFHEDRYFLSYPMVAKLKAQAGITDYVVQPHIANCTLAKILKTFGLTLTVLSGHKYQITAGT